MAATIIPASVFAAHANKLRAVRLEKLARSIRPAAANPLGTRIPPAAVAAQAKSPQRAVRRPGIFTR